MAAFRTLLGVIFFCFAAAPGAQTPGVGESRPSAAQKKEPPAHELKRCEEFSGTQREDCLRELRAAEGRAAAGATRRPEPPTAPPPYNPR